MGGGHRFETVVEAYTSQSTRVFYEAALYADSALLAIFTLLVCYRCWEFIKYELKMPDQADWPQN